MAEKINSSEQAQIEQLTSSTNPSSSASIDYPSTTTTTTGSSSNGSTPSISASNDPTERGQDEFQFTQEQLKDSPQITSPNDQSIPSNQPSPSSPSSSPTKQRPPLAILSHSKNDGTSHKQSLRTQGSQSKLPSHKEEGASLPSQDDLSSPPRSPISTSNSSSKDSASSQTSATAAALRSPGPSTQNQAFIYPMRSAVTVKQPSGGGEDGSMSNTTSPRTASGKQFPSPSSTTSRQGGNAGTGGGGGGAGHRRTMSSATDGSGGPSPKGAVLTRQPSSASSVSRSISSMMEESMRISSFGKSDQEGALGLKTQTRDSQQPTESTFPLATNPPSYVSRANSNSGGNEKASDGKAVPSHYDVNTNTGEIKKEDLQDSSLYPAPSGNEAHKVEDLGKGALPSARPPLSEYASIRHASSSIDDSPAASASDCTQNDSFSEAGGPGRDGEEEGATAHVLSTREQRLLESERNRLEAMTTTRFSHVQTADGHMVVTGRDGQLARCEDEPIHIPGAVQSFGCMIVVREDADGNLIVRQCSENSGEVLGLSPTHLFSIPSFFDCFEEDQADLLWDSVETLDENDQDLTEGGPHVFQIAGLGEPVLEGAKDSLGLPLKRKIWSCWCAAHKPQSRVDTSGKRPLIVLEFEPVTDVSNPLSTISPPGTPESEMESDVSPDSADNKPRANGTNNGSNSTSNTNSTLRDNSKNHNPYFSAPPSSSAGTATMTSSESTDNSTNDPDPAAGDALALARVRGGKKPKGGLQGEPYQPTAEEFAESTTVSSRPLKALARMRKERTTTGRRAGSSAAPQPEVGSKSQSSPLNSAPRNRRRRPNATGPELDEDGLGTGPKGEKYDYGSSDPFAGFGSASFSAGASLDMFGVLSQANEQLTAQTDLQSFLKVVVGIIREMTRFSRVMIYQFDEAWNGQVVCELVDWNDTHDLYRGLHFPATDIPKQARDLYKINKVRLLYDRDQTSARMVCREEEDLETPIDMTHSFLRAMSPIHVKYLENMGVRASMSISITAFDQLWGLIALHSYGGHGKRVPFPIRQLCRLLGESVSRNIERLSYTQRLASRKLINTLPSDTNPSGYIISNAEDLLSLFDADFGVIAIGHEAKILGPLSASQEVLAVTEYLRIKKFTTIMSSQDVQSDFPDMILPEGLGLEVVAGLLLIPLTGGGVDFIAFLRKAQSRHVNWAGKPFKEGVEGTAVLEPRKSFKIWSETVIGTCRAWKDEELETASVLCLVYGKFISVWRQREQALHYNQLNRLLLSNASHEVRTPLNHIINYLELALDGQLDADTRDNLSKSHTASKGLLFVINDLLDLTRQEQGRPLLLNELFDLSATVREAVQMHSWEARRRKIEFTLETDPESLMVIGDKNRIRQVVTNTVTNSVKYTEEGQIHVSVRKVPNRDMQGILPEGCSMSVEIVVSDTGSGIPREKLETIFREFEQVESVVPQEEGKEDLDEAGGSADPKDESGLGLGLALVARIIKNLGGQLRVDSTVGEGSRFTYYVPFASPIDEDDPDDFLSGSQRALLKQQGAHLSTLEPAGHGQVNSKGGGSTGGSESTTRSEIDSLVEAIAAPHMIEGEPSNPGALHRAGSNRSSSNSIEARTPQGNRGNSGSEAGKVQAVKTRPPPMRRASAGRHNVEGSAIPLRSVKVDPHSLDSAIRHTTGVGGSPKPAGLSPPISATTTNDSGRSAPAPIVSPKVSGDRARRKAQSKSQPSSLVTSQKVSPLRILVVEDDPINRMILKKRLVMDGHSVLLAVNGEEGVMQFEQDGDKMDLILMDLQMPICNGQDACKRIRACEKGRSDANQLADRPAAHVLNGRIPIFAVSATLDEGMREEMGDIGMDGWLLKPVDFARLRILMRGITHIEQRQKDRWVPGFHWEKGGWLSDPASR